MKSNCDGGDGKQEREERGQQEEVTAELRQRTEHTPGRRERGEDQGIPASSAAPNKRRAQGRLPDCDCAERERESKADREKAGRAETTDHRPLFLCCLVTALLCCVPSIAKRQTAQSECGGWWLGLSVSPQTQLAFARTLLRPLLSSPYNPSHRLFSVIVCVIFCKKKRDTGFLLNRNIRKR